jgi:hypothetical protein
MVQGDHLPQTIARVRQRRDSNAEWKDRRRRFERTTPLRTYAMGLLGGAPERQAIMRPLGWIGAVLIVAGCVVLAMRGLSYTKERQEVNIGPVEVAAERKGFIPPAAGAAAVAIGVVLVFVGRKKKA